MAKTTINELGTRTGQVGVEQLSALASFLGVETFPGAKLSALWTAVTAALGVAVERRGRSVHNEDVAALAVALGAETTSGKTPAIWGAILDRISETTGRRAYCVSARWEHKGRSGGAVYVYASREDAEAEARRLRACYDFTVESHRRIGEQYRYEVETSER